MPTPTFQEQIQRLSENESRYDTFINADASTSYTTNTEPPVQVESVRKFLARKDAEINQSGAGILAQATAQAAIATAQAAIAAAQADDAADQAAIAQVAAASLPPSPIVQSLRRARDNNNNAQVSAKTTSFQQPIVTSPLANDSWRGVVRANGLHFHVPYDAQAVLIHNPDTGDAYQTNFGLPFSAQSPTGLAKWRGAVVGRDGKIYCVPYNATTILVIDPVSLTASFETFGLATASLSAGAKWHDGCLGPDGKIYCAPYQATRLLVIDPLNQTANVYTSAQCALAAGDFNAGTKWSGVVAVGNFVYAIPFGQGTSVVASNAVLRINTAATPTTANPITATLETYGLNTANTPGTPSLYDASKWTMAVVYGTRIFCCPFNSADILIIDTLAGTATRTALGASLADTSKWRALVAVGRMIYGVPGNAVDFLVIDPIANTATRTAMSIFNVRSPLTAPVLTGLKWAGAVAYKGIIYGCPNSSTQAGQDILIIDPAANAGAGQAIHTDLRAFIDGGGTGSTKWFGAVTHPNGYVYAIPASSVSFLVIKDTDPLDDSPTAVLTTMGLTLSADPQKYQGGVLAGDSCIYAFPRTNATTILKIDPSDLTASIYGTASQSNYGGARDRETGATGVQLTAGDGGALLPTGDPLFVQKWHSCVVGMDGKIYAIPYDVEKVLIFDPYAVDAQKLELTNFGLNLVGLSKWVGAVLHPNGKIYCGPRASSMCLVIDTNPASSTYNTAVLTNFGTNLDTGSAAGSVGIKWSFAHIGGDGRIYMLPRSAVNVLVIDPFDTSVSIHGKATFETFGLDMSPFFTMTGEGYTISSKLGPDGKIYAACVTQPPVGTGNFLVIDTVTRKATFQDYGLAASLNAANKFAGAALTLTGRIIFIPRTFGNAVTLKLKNVSPLPADMTLGPYVNKN